MTEQKSVLDNKTKEIFKKEDDTLSRIIDIIFGDRSESSLTLEELILSPQTGMEEITSRLDTIEFFMNNEKASEDLKDLRRFLFQYHPLQNTTVKQESGAYSQKDMKIISHVLRVTQDHYVNDEIIRLESFKDGPSRIQKFYGEYKSLNESSDYPTKTVLEVLYEKAREMFNSESYTKHDKRIYTLEKRKKRVEKYIEKSLGSMSNAKFLASLLIPSPKSKKAKEVISKIEEETAKLEHDKDTVFFGYCNTSLPENLINQFLKFYGDVRKQLTDLSVYDHHANTAKTYSLVRPEIVPKEENCLIIKQGAFDGRFFLPLPRMSKKDNDGSTLEKQEKKIYSYDMNGKIVPNDLHMDNEKRVEVKEGPNAAGKTFGMKSEVYIAIRALSGNFVPAEYAKVSIRDHIIIRAKGEGIGMSALEQDVDHVNSVMPKQGEYWLVGLDETWLSTEERGGVSLLAGTISEIAGQGKSLLLISNHFPQLYGKLKSNHAVKFCHYPFEIDDMGDINFLRTKQPTQLQSFDYGIKVAQTIFGNTHPMIAYAKQRLEERLDTDYSYK